MEMDSVLFYRLAGLAGGALVGYTLPDEMVLMGSLMSAFGYIAAAGKTDRFKLNAGTAVQIKQWEQWEAALLSVVASLQAVRFVRGIIEWQRVRPCLPELMEFSRDPIRLWGTQLKSGVLRGHYLDSFVPVLFVFTMLGFCAYRRCQLPVPATAPPPRAPVDDRSAAEA